MIGAIINAGKGIADSIKLKEQNKQLEEEIKQYENPENLLSDLDDYSRTIAKNQMLLAEYNLERNQYIKTSDIKALWERVKDMMNQNIKEVEEQLKLQEANKLDIALLISGLSQLSTQFDLELLTLKEQIETVSNYDEVKKEIHDRLIWMKETLKKEQNDLFHTFQQTFVTHEENFGKLIKQKEQIFSNKVAELNTTMNSSIKDLHRALDQLQKEYRAADNKINSFILQIQKELVDQLQKLDENLKQHKQYVNEVELKFEQLVQTKEQEQKELLEKQKKLTFSLTIPLYVICVAIGVFLFFQ